MGKRKNEDGVCVAAKRMRVDTVLPRGEFIGEGTYGKVYAVGNGMIAKRVTIGDEDCVSPFEFAREMRCTTLASDAECGPKVHHAYCSRSTLVTDMVGPNTLFERPPRSDNVPALARDLARWALHCPVEHLDLKPNNVANEGARLRVFDYGHSLEFDPENPDVLQDSRDLERLSQRRMEDIESWGGVKAMRAYVETYARNNRASVFGHLTRIATGKASHRPWNHRTPTLDLEDLLYNRPNSRGCDVHDAPPMPSCVPHQSPHMITVQHLCPERRMFARGLAPHLCVSKAGNAWSAGAFILGVMMRPVWSMCLQNGRAMDFARYAHRVYGTCEDRSVHSMLAGTILAVLVGGPGDGANEKRLYELAAACFRDGDEKILERSPFSTYMDGPTRRIVTALCTRDPIERLALCKQALSYRWLAQGCPTCAPRAARAERRCKCAGGAAWVSTVGGSARPDTGTSTGPTAMRCALFPPRTERRPPRRTATA